MANHADGSSTAENLARVPDNFARAALPGARALVVLLVLAIGMPASRGQDQERPIDFQLFMEAPTQFRLRDKWRLFVEPSPRVGGDHFRLNQMLFRSGIVYQPTNWFAARGTYDAFFNYEPSFFYEQRLAQQLFFLKRLQPVWVSSRTRLEERLIERVQGASIRLRQQLSLEYPIRATPWALLLYDELFCTLNKTSNGPARGFDRNRIFAGVNRRLAPTITLQIGYRLEYINHTDTDDEGRNQLLVNLTSIF